MLNIYDLHKKRFQRDAQRQHYYKKILHKCYQRIVNVSNNCETKCVFKIPEFLIGMPIYNNIECAKYLISCLKENGFYIRYTHPNLLFISWDKIPKSHYPGYKEPSQSHEKKPIKKSNSNKYRNIYDTNSNNKLLYSNKLLNNLENRMKNIFK